MNFSTKNAARLAGIFQLRGKGTRKLEILVGVVIPSKVRNWFQT